MKSFLVTHPWFPDMQTVVAAPSASKARYSQYSGALRAGYYNIKLFDFEVKRLPDFDELAERQTKTITLGWADKHMSFGCMAKDDIYEEQG